MSKAAAWTMMAMLMLFVGCDNGPVGKALNCREICSKAQDCLPNFDESKCRSDCKDDASKDDVAKCSDCLDGDSCVECAADCTGVGIDVLIK